MCSLCVVGCAHCGWTCRSALCGCVALADLPTARQLGLGRCGPASPTKVGALALKSARARPPTKVGGGLWLQRKRVEPLPARNGGPDVVGSNLWYTSRVGFFLSSLRCCLMFAPVDHGRKKKTEKDGRARHSEWGVG